MRDDEDSELEDENSDLEDEGSDLEEEEEYDPEVEALGRETGQKWVKGATAEARGRVIALERTGQKLNSYNVADAIAGHPCPFEEMHGTWNLLLDRPRNDANPLKSYFRDEFICGFVAAVTGNVGGPPGRSKGQGRSPRWDKAGLSRAVEGAADPFFADELLFPHDREPTAADYLRLLCRFVEGPGQLRAFQMWLCELADEAHAEDEVGDDDDESMERPSTPERAAIPTKTVAAKPTKPSAAKPTKTVATKPKKPGAAISKKATASKAPKKRGRN